MSFLARDRTAPGPAVAAWSHRSSRVPNILFASALSSGRSPIGARFRRTEHLLAAFPKYSPMNKCVFGCPLLEPRRRVAALSHSFLAEYLVEFPVGLDPGGFIRCLFLSPGGLAAFRLRFVQALRDGVDDVSSEFFGNALVHQGGSDR